MNKRIKKKQNNGFTLIEMIISVAVFVVIVTISLGAVVSVLDAGRRSYSMKSVLTNLNIAMEGMSKDIKFGRIYHCDVTSGTITLPQSCSSGASSISFLASDGITQAVYRLSNGRIQKSVDAGSNYSTLTAPDVIIQDLTFYVLGAAAGDLQQPRVLITVRGYSGNKPTTQSSFILQTTVSQRNLDS